MTKLEIFVTKCAPLYWLFTAEELKFSCDSITQNYLSSSKIHKFAYPDPMNNNALILKDGISRGFYLIAGLIIENLLKGICVLQDSKLINSGKIHKPIITHNLNDLLDLINGLNLNKNELILIKKLSEAIPYWGRYPIPLIFDNIKNEINISKSDIKCFEKIYHKLVNKINKDLIKNGWQSGIKDGIGSILNYRCL